MTSSAVQRTAIDDLYYSQASISDLFKDLRPLHELVQVLRAEGADPDAILGAQLINVVLHNGRMYSMDNRRLWCLKAALPGQTQICVKLHSSAEGYGVERFLAKFSTTNGGTDIRVLKSYWAMRKEVHHVSQHKDGGASNAGSSFTTKSLDYVTKFGGSKDLAWSDSLVKATLESGCRLLARQKTATDKHRDSLNLRLYGWLYVHRVSATEMGEAIRTLQSSGFGVGDVRLAGGCNKRGGKGVGKGTKGKSASKDVFQVFGPLVAQELEQQLQATPLYHYVIRGSDPRFCDLSTRKGGFATVVHAYFGDDIIEFKEQLWERLQEVFDMPEEVGQTRLEYFQDVMNDLGYVSLLKEYFESGNTVDDDKLQLVGRMGGKHNFLHRIIRLRDVELLRYLLDHYTKEKTHLLCPWLRLVEPLCPVGPYRISAFHRAVWDNHPDCLDLLVQYAQACGHDITHLRNVEDPRVGHASGKTALKLAEDLGHLSCYNILAPAFGVAIREHLDNSEEPLSRAEKLITSGSFVHLGYQQGRNQHFQLLAEMAIGNQGTYQSWCQFSQDVSMFLHAQRHAIANSSQGIVGRGGSTGPAVKIVRVQFETDCSQSDVSNFDADMACAGNFSAVYFGTCKVPNPAKSILSWLQYLHQRIEHAETASIGFRMVKFNFGRCGGDVCFDEDEEMVVVKDIEELMRKFVMDLFLERGVYLDLSYKDLFAAFQPRLDPMILVFADAFQHASRPAAKADYLYRQAIGSEQPDEREQHSSLGFYDRLSLLAPVDEIRSQYWKDRDFAVQNVTDVSCGLQPRSIVYVELIVRMWFRSWKRAEHGKTLADDTGNQKDVDSGWLFFVVQMVQWREGNRNRVFCSATECSHIHVDHTVTMEKVLHPVREAIDVALESIVRMHHVLEHAFRRCKVEFPGGVAGVAYDNFPSFLSFFKSLIPPLALIGLPCTRAKLSKYGLDVH